MLVFTFFIALILFVLAFISLISKDKKEYAGYLTLAGLGTLLLTFILLVSCAIVGGKNYERVEITNYTYESNAYEFELEGKKLLYFKLYNVGT